MCSSSSYIYDLSYHHYKSFWIIFIIFSFQTQPFYIWSILVDNSNFIICEFYSWCPIIIYSWIFWILSCSIFYYINYGIFFPNIFYDPYIIIKPTDFDDSLSSAIYVWFAIISTKIGICINSIKSFNLILYVNCIKLKILPFNPPFSLVN